MEYYNMSIKPNRFKKKILFEKGCHLFKNLEQTSYYQCGYQNNDLAEMLILNVNIFNVSIVFVRFKHTFA